MPVPLEALTDTDREELRLLYQSSAADIALFTRQQWWVTNYALAIDAALLYIAVQAVNPVSTLAPAWLIILITWLVCLSALFGIKRLQISIANDVRRMERARSTFGRAFLEIVNQYRPRQDVHRLLYLVSVLASIVVTVLVAARA